MGFILLILRLSSVIALITGATWERINIALVKEAWASGLETLKQARIDSTVTAALIHEPYDSTLLGDAQRVLERLMTAACARDAGLRYTSNKRVVKKQVMAIREQRRG